MVSKSLFYIKDDEVGYSVMKSAFDNFYNFIIEDFTGKVDLFLLDGVEIIDNLVKDFPQVEEEIKELNDD